MKVFSLFLFLFLCIGCTNQIEKRANLLGNELAATPLLSTSFDSILQVIRELPSQQKVRIISRMACQEAKGKKNLLKQEKLLLEILPVATNKKEILLLLIDLYIKMDSSDIIDTDKKGIKLCEILENNYSLSQEERWEIKKIKASLLNRRGQQKQYLPIWAELLIEHQVANNSELIIEDLRIIANHFTQLDDFEKGLSLYREAYQLAINNQYPELQNQCLIALINTSYDSKRYQETIYYINQYQNDSSFTYSTCSILAKCYLELQKPDSARIYLSKMNLLSKRKHGVLIHCRIAETYISESNEDSAAFYLNKAQNQFKEQNKNYKEKNIETFLPAYFLPVYSSFATLLRKNKKVQQANDAFELVKPLMMEPTKDPNQLETQIKGLTLFSAFCRNTGKYEKALDLLARRDSIQEICNRYKEERDSRNLIDYHESEAIIANTKVNITKELYFKRYLGVISTAGLFSLFVAALFFYLYYRVRKKIRASNQSEQTALLKPVDPAELRFRAIEKEVLSRKLYLDKKMSLTSLQQELKINRGDLSNCINTYSGGNFNLWKNTMRINYALEHIQHTPVNRLIEESGFASSSSFYSCFKELTGYTPKEYIDLRLFEQQLSLQQIRMLSERSKKKSGNPSTKRITALYKAVGKLASRLFKTT